MESRNGLWLSVCLLRFRQGRYTEGCWGGVSILSCRHSVIFCRRVRRRRRFGLQPFSLWQLCCLSLRTQDNKVPLQRVEAAS